MHTRQQIDLNALADRFAGPVISQRRKLIEAQTALHEGRADAAACAFAALARDIELYGISPAGGTFPQLVF